MAVLAKLQEKIEAWKEEHEALKEKNHHLKSQLASLAETQTKNETLQLELDAKNSRLKQLEEDLEIAKMELEEKDAEVEKILKKVEALLA